MTFRTIELVVLVVFALIVGLTVHAWLIAQDNQQRLQSTLSAQKQVIDDANSHQRARDAALNNTLAEIEKLKNTTQSSQQLVDQLQKYLALPQPMLLVNRGLSPSVARGKRLSPVTHQSRLSTVPVGSGSTNGNPPTRANLQIPAPMGRQDLPKPLLNSPEARLRSDAPSPSLQPDPPPASPTVQPILPLISGKSCSGSTECSAQIPNPDLKPLYNYVQDCRACDAELAVGKQNASDDAAKIAALTRERDAAITASKGGSFLRRLRRDILWLCVGAAMGYAARR